MTLEQLISKDMSLTDQGRETLRPMFLTLNDYYNKRGVGFRDNELLRLLDFDEEYDQELYEKVCKPFDFKNGGCLVMVGLYFRELDRKQLPVGA
jgi:hypothetical protein